MGLQLRGTPQPPLLLRTAAVDGDDTGDGHGGHGAAAGERGQRREVVGGSARSLGGSDGGGGFLGGCSADWGAAD